jgi:hypothetical protein
MRRVQRSHAATARDHRCMVYLFTVVYLFIVAANHMSTDIFYKKKTKKLQEQTAT